MITADLRIRLTREEITEVADALECSMWLSEMEQSNISDAARIIQRPFNINKLNEVIDLLDNARMLFMNQAEEWSERALVASEVDDTAGALIARPRMMATMLANRSASNAAKCEDALMHMISIRDTMKEALFDIRAHIDIVNQKFNRDQA